MFSATPLEVARAAQSRTIAALSTPADTAEIQAGGGGGLARNTAISAASEDTLALRSIELILA